MPGSPAFILRRVGRYALLTVLAVVILFPLYMVVVQSLFRGVDFAARPPLLYPPSPQWSSYPTAWTDGHLGTYLRNSFIMTVCITAGQLLTSILAAYAFAFLHFPFKRTIFVIFLATMMIPLEVVFITNVVTVTSFGWYNTYAGLVVPSLATGFGTFLLRQAFLSLPRELRDAAAIDGFGDVRFLTRVVVPLARPTVAALAVLGFLGAWNQYLWPLVVTKDDAMRTVQIGLKQLTGTSIDQFNVTSAGTVLAFVPIVLILLIFHKQLVRGLTAGAVKG